MDEISTNNESQYIHITSDMVPFTNSYDTQQLYNMIECKNIWISIKQNILINNENTPDIINALKTCKQISLQEYFEETLDCLPDEITHISIHYKCNFNHPINNLPYNLKCLHILSKSFIQPLDNLPLGIEELFIGNMNYNLPLDNLPNGLKILKFMRLSKYNQQLRNLPSTIEKIILYKFYPFSNEIKELYPKANIIILEW